MSVDEEPIRVAVSCLELCYDVKKALKFLTCVNVPYRFIRKHKAKKAVKGYLQSSEKKIREQAELAKRNLKGLQHIEKMEKKKEAEKQARKATLEDFLKPIPADDHSNSLVRVDSQNNDINMSPSDTRSESSLPEMSPSTVGELTEEFFKPRREMQKVYAGAKKTNNTRQETMCPKALEIENFQREKKIMGGMTYIELNKYLEENPQNLLVADIFYFQFLQNDFPDKVDEKPSELSWKCWYAQMKSELEKRKLDNIRNRIAAQSKKNVVRTTATINTVHSVGRRNHHIPVQSGVSIHRAPQVSRSSSSQFSSNRSATSRTTHSIQQRRASNSNGVNKTAPLMAKCRKMAMSMRR